MASDKGHIEIVHKLLEKGANIKAKTTKVSIDMYREYV